MTITIVSWNIAGIRASIRKGDLDSLHNIQNDIICFQETKADESQVILPKRFLEDYPHRYWSNNKGITQRKGFSGTCTLSKIKGVQLDPPEIDLEGRVTTVEYDKFILVNVYTPNSQHPGSDRFIYRTQAWDNEFNKYINILNKRKPTIICGDMNVAHKDIDVYEPKRKVGKSGFLPEEQTGFQKHLDCGYLDAFRCVCQEPNKYTYWDQRFPKLRENNKGWRIDYFMIPENLKNNLINCEILKEITGSDHCPITINIDIDTLSI